MFTIALLRNSQADFGMKDVRVKEDGSEGCRCQNPKNYGKQIVLCVTVFYPTRPSGFGIERNFKCTGDDIWTVEKSWSS